MTVLSMEKPIRKQNRLKEWSYSNGGVYFLTVCTKDRAKILSSVRPDPNGAYFYGGDEFRLTVELTPLGKIVEKYLLEAEKTGRFLVEDFVIMPNHMHILLGIPGDVLRDKEQGVAFHEEVPKFLSGFKTLCHKAAGDKFLQRSAYDHVIRNQYDYDEIARYMHQNPARWYHRELYGTEE